MKYAEEGPFAYESEDVDVVFSHGPFAEIAASLLEIKAMEEYFTRQGNKTNLKGLPQFEDTIVKLRRAYSALLGTKQIESVPLLEVSQDGIREAFKRRDIDLVARLATNFI